ncbi:hypothetical protein BJF92_11220 [Rhizobium rhizosphaerae]|uniref:Uncharacterized protein n=2 Tax=Xaviernesmea rhizosphaerae TaxID=1672749 RepID=A0A1Q9AMN6_9HYPH|nr:hypothetical protein BJF92_11220 [Xaviernesmea rhizosphaerae]
MCARSPYHGDNSRTVSALGDLQPTVFGVEGRRLDLRTLERSPGPGRIVFSCGALIAHPLYGETWCVMTYELPRQKNAAKAALAELEACARDGRPTPARAAWDRYCAEKAAAKATRASAPARHVHSTGQFDLLGALL